MALNSWQKLTRVLTGKPFGTYADGDYSSATSPTMTPKSCSGTADSSSLTIGSAGFTNGDVVLIQQTRGTGVGQFEINRISSGGGSTSLTMQEPLKYTYTDSGDSQAQIIKIPMYKDVTVESGTWTPDVWNGDISGILVIACKSITPTGSISLNSAGFRGGTGLASGSDNVSAYQGEGTAGAGVNTFGTAQNANGNGGGAARRQTGSANGSAAAGGGHATAASNAGGGSGTIYGGGAVGSDGMTTINLGGAGGGALVVGGGTAGTGGKGGGIVIIFAKTINAPTSISANGGNGGSTSGGTNKACGSGGGAGGSILLCGETINIGTDKLSALAGTKGSTTSSNEVTNGTDGTKGRIAVYYSKSLTGSVSSSLYGSYLAEQDTSLVESAGGGFLQNFL